MTRLNLPLNQVAAVELTLRRDFVELRYDDRCVAVIDRDELRAWLIDSRRGRFPIDDVTWHRLERGHVHLTIHHRGAWTLGPALVRDLADHLGGLR